MQLLPDSENVKHFEISLKIEWHFGIYGIGEVAFREL